MKMKRNAALLSCDVASNMPKLNAVSPSYRSITIIIVGKRTLAATLISCPEFKIIGRLSGIVRLRKVKHAHSQRCGKATASHWKNVQPAALILATVGATKVAAMPFTGFAKKV